MRIKADSKQYFQKVAHANEMILNGFSMAGKKNSPI